MTDRRRARIELLFKTQERAARHTSAEGRRFHHAVAVSFNWLALDLAFSFLWLCDGTLRTGHCLPVSLGKNGRVRGVSSRLAWAICRQFAVVGQGMRKAEGPAGMSD